MGYDIIETVKKQTKKEKFDSIKECLVWLKQHYGIIETSLIFANGNASSNLSNTAGLVLLGKWPDAEKAMANLSEFYNELSNEKTDGK